MPFRLSLVALLACFTCASPAAAFCRLTTESRSASQANRYEKCANGGIELAWKRPCVSYTVVPNDALDLPLEDVRSTIDRSFRTWMDVTCGEPAMPLAIRFGQTEDLGACDLGEYNRFGPNANTIVFVSEDWGSRGADFVDDAYGVTLVWHNPETGEILDADIQVNLTRDAFAICGERCEDRYVDLENVITHEAGHFLGLSHSEVSTATMYREAPVAQVEKRTLESDDIAGACDIYGGGEPLMCEDKDFAPRRGFTPRCSQPMESSSCALRIGPIGRGALAGFTVLLIGLALLARRRLAGLALALPLSLIASEASAFCQLTTEAPSPLAQCSTAGHGLAWTRSCISYTVVPPPEGSGLDLDAVRDTIDEAFGAWTTVDCGGDPLPLTLGQSEQPGACTTAQYNVDAPNANLILFLEEWDPSELPREVFALTLVWHSPKTGEIFDADMLLNATLAPFEICDQSCPNGVSDLANVVTHEAGHFLGLGHSHIPEATMATTAFLGDVDKRSLEQDDRQGVCSIYGARAEPSCEGADFLPNNGFTSKCVADLPACDQAGSDEPCEDREGRADASAEPQKSGGGGCAVRRFGPSQGSLTLLLSSLIALLAALRWSRAHRG